MNVARQIFSVRGMHCKSCEKLLQMDIGALSGVSAVRADHKAGKVEVEGDGFDEHAIRSAIRNNGYEA